MQTHQKHPPSIPVVVPDGIDTVAFQQTSYLRVKKKTLVTCAELLTLLGGIWGYIFVSTLPEGKYSFK